MGQLYQVTLNETQTKTDIEKDGRGWKERNGVEKGEKKDRIGSGEVERMRKEKTRREENECEMKEEVDEMEGEE